MPDITEVISNTNSRVTALENNDLADKTGVARIVKIYGNLKITMTVAVRKRSCLTPSNSLYPGSDVFDQIFIEG